MATNTISLGLDAYEYLLNQKQGGESFSAVVRRARSPSETSAVSNPPASYVSGPAETPRQGAQGQRQSITTRLDP